MEDLSLAFQLSKLHSSHFTGRLDIASASDRQWSLYLFLGRLVWQAGDSHASERWHRLLSWCCPDINVPDLKRTNSKPPWSREYSLLLELLQDQRIKREQGVALIEYAVIEVLFDILQEQHLRATPGNQQNSRLSFRTDVTDTIQNPLKLMRVEQAMLEAKRQWIGWQAAGLAAYSPNLIPVIQQSALLLKRTSTPEYQRLAKWVDGKQTLRGLAPKLQQDPLTLTRSFVEYKAWGIINFLGFEDSLGASPASTTGLSEPHLGAAPSFSSENSSGGNPLIVDQSKPLITCIDDSVTVCDALRRIITRAGYQFSAIQETHLAIAMLLKHKPDLIFLDLIMPIANGYEICSQIRRISRFRNTPVVILTSNDGLIDRVRAKIVGANDFLSKPVDRKKVLPMLYKHLSSEAELRRDGIKVFRTSV
jgi:chemotaxis family two-component system response regulator PixG